MLNYGLKRLWNVRNLTAFNMILSVLLILSLLILIRDLLQPELHLSTETNNVETQKRDIGSLDELAPILKNNPFGFSAGELKPITDVSKAEASSSLELRLIGTISGGVDYAIFITKDGKQEVFKRGDKIFDSGMLERVYKDRAVISEGGKRREIPLADILSIETVRPESLGHSTGLSFVRDSGNNTFVVSQEGILSALNNPEHLMTDARLQPNYVNGRQEGFVLREVKRGGIYQSLGLRNGDVLLRINNYDITNPEIALQALTALKGMERVDLDIIRNGSKMTLNYQLR